MSDGLRTRTTSSRGYVARRDRARASRSSADATLAELVELRTRLPIPAPLPADAAIAAIETLLPASGPGARLNLQRVSATDWEARTVDGTVGRGSCIASALTELLTVLRP